MTLATVQREDRARRITAAGAAVAELRDGVMDPDLRGVLKMAAKRLVPNIERLTLEWIRDFLRDEGDRAVCEGRDRRGSWLRTMGKEVSDLYETYHDWA